MFWIPNLTPAEWGLISSWGWKLFIDFAESLPPPSETAGYWKIVAYNFMQRLASNSSKLVTRKCPTQSPSSGGGLNV